MQLFNFHTHTHYCDGSDEPEQYVLRAIERQFQALGFSGHAPIPYNFDWSIKKDNIMKYVQEITLLKSKYQKELPIFLGLEADYIPGMMGDFSGIKSKYGLDYIIGSVHLVKSSDKNEVWFIDGDEKFFIDGMEHIYNGDAPKAVGDYYRQIMEMIINERPDVVGHIDKVRMNNKNRYFTNNEPWYRELIVQLIDVIDKYDVIIEVNTRGIYKKRCDTLFPEEAILKQLCSRNMPITLSSDAHKPEELDYLLSETAYYLKNLGFKQLYVLSEGQKWMPQEL